MFFPTSLGEEGKSSVTLLSRKIGHYHPRKAPVLVLRAAPLWRVSGSQWGGLLTSSHPGPRKDMNVKVDSPWSRHLGLDI